MKGDFSKLQFDPSDNFTGVLHQQGRVLLDQDWNAANAIASHLRQMQGRDAIGANVAAVPGEASGSFQVVQASTDGTVVHVTLNPGRVWVDGWLLQLAGTAPYARPVEYFGPPIQTPPVDPSTIANGVRDAVILEVWEETISAFQDPQALIEPALGGVDTTGRAKLFHDVKLLRLAPGDDCGNLAPKLADDFSTKGKLTVTPAPTFKIGGECPVALAGGYTGSEHYLFRIEITEPDAGNARFKWSRFAGGLVGRGTFDGAATVSIKANDQMIKNCGLTSFYLEALGEASPPGRWTVMFTAEATLSDSTLTLTNVNGTWPGDARGVAFFRLWDGVDLVANFPSGLPTPKEVQEGLGIRLEFAAPTAGNDNYRPGDFWTFPVRTAGTEGFDPATHWPRAAPPEGIHYHRVPLAILNWDAAATTIQAPDRIDDCRHRFAPLTGIREGCCLAVAPGEDLHVAVRKVKAAGGRLYLLAGRRTPTKWPAGPFGHDQHSFQRSRRGQPPDDRSRHRYRPV